MYLNLFLLVGHRTYARYLINKIINQLCDLISHFFINLVAQVARQILLKNNTEALELAENVTNILKSVSHGKVNNFVESACWADDLKSYKLLAMSNWHFTDIPILLNSTKLEIPKCTDCSKEMIVILYYLLFI